MRFKIDNTTIIVAIIVMLFTLTGFVFWNKYLTKKNIEACKNSEYCVTVIKSAPMAATRCLNDEACIREILIVPSVEDEGEQE